MALQRERERERYVYFSWQAYRTINAVNERVN